MSEVNTCWIPNLLAKLLALKFNLLLKNLSRSCTAGSYSCFINVTASVNKLFLKSSLVTPLLLSALIGSYNLFIILFIIPPISYSSWVIWFLSPVIGLPSKSTANILSISDPTWALVDLLPLYSLTNLSCRLLDLLTLVPSGKVTSLFLASILFLVNLPISPLSKACMWSDKYAAAFCGVSVLKSPGK